MEIAAISSFLFMGLGLGVVHAFDPDHLAAVGGLSTGNGGEVQAVNSPARFFGNFRFAIQWSLGHGAALLAISLLVFVAGAAIPTQVSELAEHSVAFLLIVIGLLAFWRIYARREHKGGSIGAPIVGLIHGTAGSAPLLALIPISQMAQPAVGVAYVLFFSAGVILAMMTLGGLFAHSMRMVQRNFHAVHAAIQGIMAAFSLLLGIYLTLSHF